MSNFNSQAGLTVAITNYAKGVKAELGGVIQGGSTDFAQILGRETELTRKNEKMIQRNEKVIERNERAVQKDAKSHRVRSADPGKPADASERKESCREDRVGNKSGRGEPEPTNSQTETPVKKPAANDQDGSNSQVEPNQAGDNQPDTANPAERKNRSDDSVAAEADASQTTQRNVNNGQNRLGLPDVGLETGSESGHGQANGDPSDLINHSGLEFAASGGLTEPATETGQSVLTTGVDMASALQVVPNDSDTGLVGQAVAGVEVQVTESGSTITGTPELAVSDSARTGEPLTPILDASALNQSGRDEIGSLGIERSTVDSEERQIYSGPVTDADDLELVPVASDGAENENLPPGVGLAGNAPVSQPAATALTGTETSLSRAGEAMRQAAEPAFSGQSDGRSAGLSDQAGDGQAGQQRSTMNQTLQTLIGQQTPAAGQKTVSAGQTFDDVMSSLESKGVKVAPMPAEQRAQSSLQAKDFSILKNYTTSLPTPINQDEWSDEFVEKVKWLTSKQFRSAEIHVRPAELGPIEIKISVQNDQTSIVFNSQHASVRDLLELNVHRLRDMLDASGVNLADVDVSDQSAQHSSGSEEGLEGDAQENTGRDGGPGDDVASGESSAMEMATAPKGLVDTFA